MLETDKVFAGSIPENYDRYIVPLIFEPFAADLARRAASLSPDSVLEIAAGTQSIAAAAHFLEFDGLCVPSARADCHNLVLFLDRVADGNDLNVRETEAVDWEKWRRGRKER
ncbi:MAG TPA: RES family NAD+ phosphorylase [Dongiaceae bacterium]|jgi:hypothetical protein